MAAVEPASKSNSWHSRRRPFSQWVKRLANLKSSSSDSQGSSSKKGNTSKKASPVKNNPYPESGLPRNEHKSANGHLSFTSPSRGSTGSFVSLEGEGGAASRRAPTISNKSAAPTVATNPETVHSETSQSKAGTAISGGGGANSTFSSPNQSVQSLTTTLTTIQSTAPSGLLNPTNGPAAGGLAQPAQSVQFSHQYPVSPASAIPPHLAPSTVPQTYHAATANGMLTDNASILTLASSSKRRRRNSLDTNASVRALAPSSVWGGSRESLPLSVLSDRVDIPPPVSAGRPGPNITGFASAERASVYSSSGVAAPVLTSERNSYYASKQIDSASVRSGKLGHGRSESVTGSIGGVNPSSPLASPRDTTFPNRLSRRSSDWKRADSGSEDEEDDPVVVKDGGKPIVPGTS